MTKKVSTVEDVLEMFRDNIVDVDVVEESAILVRNVFTIVTIAILVGAIINVSIALMLSAHP